MGLFYTGKGDRGSSHIGKKKFPKDSLLLEVLGELDELNSLCGLVRSLTQDKSLAFKLQNVQGTLFIIQARIAWFLYPKFQSPELKEEKIKELESEIESIEKRISPERGFIIPGSDQGAAWLDYARSVSRRVERKVFSLSKKKKVPSQILVYLNRLSSYLYALARIELHEKNIKEPKPTYT